MIDNMSGAKNKLKGMREKVKEELEHIPRGSFLQNEFRMCYQCLRMHSLGKHAKTELTMDDVFKQAKDLVTKDNPEFRPNYDPEFFLTR